MRPIVIVVAGAMAFAAPGSAAAGPTSERDREEAAQECRDVKQAAGGRANFAALMETTKARAMPKCRKRQARRAHRERHRAAREAAEQCAGAPDVDACVGATRRALNAQAEADEAAYIQQVSACRADASTSAGQALVDCVGAAASAPPTVPPIDITGRGVGSMGSA
jgi:hypothetical protein